MTCSDELLSADYHEDMNYDSLIKDGNSLTGHVFEDCTFTDCRFDRVSFSGTVFTTCVFEGSSLTMCDFTGATLNGVRFLNAKLMGLNFTETAKFAFSPEFRNSLIDSSVFFANHLSSCLFEDCTIRNTDFTECNLKEASFRRSCFEAVIFHNCNLEKSVFLGARDYEIDPFSNRLKNACFDLPEAQSFLGFLGIKLND